MGAWDAWASALAGGSVGGAATGLALWFTIRHDRRARSDDRRYEAATRALAAGTVLAATIVRAENEGHFGGTVEAALDLRAKDVLLRAHLSPRDRRLANNLKELADAAYDGISHPPTGSFDERGRELVHTVAAYVTAISRWIRDPNSARKKQATASQLIAEIRQQAERARER